MSAWDSIVKTFIDKIWPFFVQHLWPALKDEVIKFVSKLVTRIFEWMHAKVDSHAANAKATFAAKAQEADQQASEAKSEDERKHLEDIARVWREALDVVRRENEELKLQLAEYRASEQAGIEADVQFLQPHLEPNVLVIGGGSIPLKKLAQ